MILRSRVRASLTPHLFFSVSVCSQGSPTINTCLLRRAHQSQMLNSDFPMDKQWHMRRDNRRYHRDFTGTLVSSVFRYMLVNGYCVESSTTTNNGGEHACHTSIYPSRFACHKLADLQMQATTCPPLAGEAIYTCEMNQQKVTLFSKKKRRKERRLQDSTPQEPCQHTGWRMCSLVSECVPRMPYNCRGIELVRNWS